MTVGGLSLGLVAGSANASPPAPTCHTGQISWTPSLAAGVDSTTVSLVEPAGVPIADLPTCSVSLNSYDTSGPTWLTSSPQVFLDHISATLSPTNLSQTLTVTAPDCFGQIDLYGGTTRYDGVDGPLPTPPNSTIGPLFDSWNGGSACTTPPGTTGVTPAVPTFTDVSCSVAIPSFTIPATTGVSYFVDGSATASPAGTYPTSVNATVTITAQAQSGFVLVASTGPWSHTFNPVVGTCGTTPTTPSGPVVSATGSLNESCPTETSQESYGVTLKNTSASTPVLFQVSVNGVTVFTTPSAAPIAAGASYTYTGTLPSSTAGPVTAAFSSAPVTSWTPITLTGSQTTFPCVLGETFTNTPPTVTTPTVKTPTVKVPTAVLPISLTKPTSKPAATLPFTGLPTGTLSLIGFGFAAIGALLLVATRRRVDQLS